MNKLYRIRLTFSCPYIAQRNGGNRIVQYGLTLGEAVKNLLVLYNSRTDRQHALTWEEAVFDCKGRFDGAFGEGESASFHYDSRVYTIEPEPEV